MTSIDLFLVAAIYWVMVIGIIVWQSRRLSRLMKALSELQRKPEKA